MKRVFLLGIIILILTGCSNKEVKKEKEISENNGMLSYTIDGEKTDIKPTKEDGFIVNKIICDNGSDMMWDNDNWEVEFTRMKSNDSCMVDYTKDVNSSGYRVTVTTNLPSALDSLSKATTENGTVKIYSKSKIENVTECNGIIEDNKVTISNITQNQTCNITIEDKTLANIIKQSYPPKNGRTDFSKIDNGAPALYTGEDDQGATYYFSGDGSSMNNWLKFADKWWRIIRINGNGSIRLLYAGDGNDATDIGKSSYNNSTNHPAYVGWKFSEGPYLSMNRGNSTKSTIYQLVENWYNGLSILNKNYIDSEAIYCNDREANENYSATYSFNYAAYERIMEDFLPIFKCKNKNDRFYNFGLMTADEIVYAGGKIGVENSKSYYQLAQDGKSSITNTIEWWTMTPYYWLSSVKYVNVFSVNQPAYMGALGTNLVSSSLIIRPVISLKPEVEVTGGDGSGDNPYTVTLP